MRRISIGEHLQTILPKQLSTRKKILHLLSSRKEKGVTTQELADIDHRFSCSIYHLRENGHIIETQLLKNGSAIYYYKGFVANQDKLTAKEKVFEEIDKKYNKKVTSLELSKILDKYNAIIKGK